MRRVEAFCCNVPTNINKTNTCKELQSNMFCILPKKKKNPTFLISHGCLGVL